MGISAIFKRSKTAPSYPDIPPGAVDAGQGQRYIRRRPPTSESHPIITPKTAAHPNKQPTRQTSDYVPNSRRSAATSGATRRTTAISHSSSLDSDDSPTPVDSLDGSAFGYNASSGGGRKSFMLPAAAKQNRSAAMRTHMPDTQNKPQIDHNDIFGLHRLTTPPPDAHPRHLKELDPFEDSPPRRPVSNFEDPVYIPPLTLAATLFDEYGVGGSAPISKTSTLLSPTTTISASATLSTDSASRVLRGSSTVGSAMPKSSADTRDFLSEFTATYSYLFGSPPSATATPSQLDNGHHGVEDGSGMLSPVGSKHAQLDNRSQSESASENNYESAEDTNTADENEGSADDGNSVLNKEQEEERRKEEERKAAELRNRRRELIKQQVAFERMKERHRRQYPGQQQSSGLHSNVVRWQRESAKAVGTIAAPFHMQGQPKGQNVLHASNATINRGHAPGTVQHSNQQPYGNNMAGGSPLYSNIHANSSMPNMAAYAMQIHQQQFPQNAALLQPMQPVAAVGSGGEGYVSDAPHQAHALNTRYPTSMSQGSLPQNSQFPPEHVAPPLSHPVKLASAPKKTKNPYLSDSDNDDDDSSSSVTSNNMSGSDSLDMSSVGSSDISCEVAPSTLLKHPQSSSSISPERTGSRVMRSISQPVLSGRESGKSSKAAGNDSSSDASAKSQSSSKRRVRFHETVSVVFNSRRSITEEEYGSDNDSSNASVNMGIEQDWAYGADQNGFISHNSKTARAGSRMEEDDAFDVGDAFNHARYHISVAASAVKGHVGVQRDTRDMSATIENNKDINPVSNRNAYPDGSKGRTKRTKHRVETQPLRDREAEREQQWQQQQQKEMQQQREQQQREQHREQQMIKQAAADAADSEAFKNTQKAESDHTSTATIAKVDMDSSSTPSTGATEPVKPVIDHMAEARRALLGHYNVPNPSLPVGTSIPRSGNARTTYVHTSSVKVLKPQSFARPKNQYSKGPSSAFASKSAEQKDDMAKSKLPGLGSQKETLAANPNSRTNQALESAISNPSDSQEFQISNVLQNFSISSFEVTKNKEGGMYIRYSDQSKKSHSNAQVSTKVSYANDTEGINGKNDSDGDEIPLAAIARSRSEPAKRVLPHTSADNHLVCLSASASTGAQDYNSNELRQSIVTSNGSRGESPKSPKHFFSRISTDSARRALTRNSSLSNSKTAASCVQKREEVVRSVSVDSGTRSPLQLQPKSHIKRRFSRWGTFFS